MKFIVTCCLLVFLVPFDLSAQVSAIRVDSNRNVAIYSDTVVHRFEVNADSSYASIEEDQNSFAQAAAALSINGDLGAGQIITCGQTGVLTGLSCLMRSIGPGSAKFNIYVYFGSTPDGDLISIANITVFNTTFDFVTIDLNPASVEEGDELFIEIEYDNDAYGEWALDPSDPYQGGLAYENVFGSWNELTNADLSIISFVEIIIPAHVPVLRVRDEAGGLVSIRDYTLPPADGLSGQSLKTDGGGNVGWDEAELSDDDWVIGPTSLYRSGDKKVGIGLSVPVSPLHVRGPSWTSMTIDAVANDPWIQLTSQCITNTDDWTMRMEVAFGDELQFRFDNSTAMTVNPAGNLGIGIFAFATSCQLCVGGNAYVDGFGDVNSYVNLNKNVSSGLALRVNNKDALALTGTTFTWGTTGTLNSFARNVGIGGATNPTLPLDVVGNVRSSSMASTGQRRVIAEVNGNLNDFESGLPSNEGIFILDYTGFTGLDDREAMEIVPFSHAYHEVTFTVMDVEELSGVMKLPHQSTISKIKVIYYDNSNYPGENLLFFFITIPNTVLSPDTLGIGASLYMGASSTANTQFQELVVDGLSIPVDNVTNTYFLVVSGTFFNPDIYQGIRKVEVYYH